MKQVRVTSQNDYVSLRFVNGVKTVVSIWKMTNKTTNFLLIYLDKYKNSNLIWYLTPKHTPAYSFTPIDLMLMDRSQAAIILP